MAAAFSHTSTKVQHKISSTELRYRSLHHGPDVEPLSDAEKQGAGFTKMDKDKINQYGPGDFTQYTDHHSSDLFDGGDSEMGLSGDGNSGLHKFGRDVSPHMTGTLTAQMDQADVSSSSYSDELLQDYHGMDDVRAQQLENWATQKEIAMANRFMNERSQYHQYDYIREHDGVHEDENPFAYPAEAGDNIHGILTMKAPVFGVAAHEILLKNPFMGYAKFRAAFVGDESSEWSVSPSDGFIKQSEDTHFIVRYRPHSPGVSNAHLVIETEDFKKTWKVVGSTGEYEF
jgi:hypothetical protein